MQGEIEREKWQTYLDDFSKRNRGRVARVEILGEELGDQEEADLLPFVGVSFESKGSDAPAIEVMLGESGAADPRDLTHPVAKPTRIVPRIGADGQEEALEIESEDGSKVILVFESVPELPA
ncbi:MAG TPA: DUF5335 family protein [Blastocatellia bacterium]